MPLHKVQVHEFNRCAGRIVITYTYVPDPRSKITNEKISVYLYPGRIYNWRDYLVRIYT